jgi:hypothetical protein
MSTPSIAVSTICTCEGRAKGNPRWTFCLARGSLLATIALVPTYAVPLGEPGMAEPESL